MSEEKQFQTLEDVKEYVESTGYVELLQSIEAVEADVTEVEGGYEFDEGILKQELPLESGMASAFRFGVLVGTYLENEYPRPEEYNNE